MLSFEEPGLNEFIISSAISLQAPILIFVRISMYPALQNLDALEIAFNRTRSIWILFDVTKYSYEASRLYINSACSDSIFSRKSSTNSTSHSFSDISPLSSSECFASCSLVDAITPVTILAIRFTILSILSRGVRMNNASGISLNCSTE